MGGCYPRSDQDAEFSVVITESSPTGCCRSKEGIAFPIGRRDCATEGNVAVSSPMTERHHRIEIFDQIWIRLPRGNRGARNQRTRSARSAVTLLSFAPNTIFPFICLLNPCGGGRRQRCITSSDQCSAMRTALQPTMG